MVTTIRASAERVRAYGGAGAGRGLVVSTPLRLHVIAALLESEMRGWAHVDETAAASFTDTVAHPLPARRIVGFPGLRVVATIVAPRAMSADVQVTELLAIVARLHSAVDDLQSALDTRAAEHYGKLISAQINGIKAFAAAIA
ncbi:hypothetical protein CIW49_26410 [Mycolicibacterium sp. P1-18]|uniref:hypothetical protein n=1 Tax=Mycolicibacterium sp. P1-18 TaxID=2024615 RepID=UPI0011F36C64|nr:hypothetical protein [Mycolicibacterium sp. P1-18]KAA0093598.1 hypothetical protein CIW49_26410 [Mycolicibacterium sp. P1-18]